MGQREIEEILENNAGKWVDSNVLAKMLNIKSFKVNRLVRSLSKIRKWSLIGANNVRFCQRVFIGINNKFHYKFLYKWRKQDEK